MTQPRVASIVLAAGGSSRLGQPKQLLLVGERPLLERTLDVVRHASPEPRIVVLGASSDHLRAEVDLRGFTVVENANWASGQASSLAVGLAALPDDVDAAVVLLGDQPLVPPWLIDDLAARFDPTVHVAARPRYADGPGNPVLLGRALFPDLLALSGDVGARDVLQRARERVLLLDYTTRPAPRDVDTRDAYAGLLLDWAACGAPDMPRYCQRCAAELGIRAVHARNRPVCPRCGYTLFYDPKIAAVTVIEIDGRIVLQRRAIDPGRGKWTFPGGFVDRGEAVHDGAAREVLEEVGLQVRDLRLLNVYSIPGETVVLIAWHARADGQTPITGSESTDVRLFAPADIPALAFRRDQLVIADWLACR